MAATFLYEAADQCLIYTAMQKPEYLILLIENADIIYQAYLHTLLIKYEKAYRTKIVGKNRYNR